MQLQLSLSCTGIPVINDERTEKLKTIFCNKCLKPPLEIMLAQPVRYEGPENKNVTERRSDNSRLQVRTVARKLSVGGLYYYAVGLYVRAGGLTFKFDKNSTNL